MSNSASGLFAALVLRCSSAEREKAVEQIPLHSVLKSQIKSIKSNYGVTFEG